MSARSSEELFDSKYSKSDEESLLEDLDDVDLNSDDDVDEVIDNETLDISRVQTDDSALENIKEQSIINEISNDERQNRTDLYQLELKAWDKILESEYEERRQILLSQEEEEDDSEFERLRRQKELREQRMKLEEEERNKRFTIEALIEAEMEDLISNQIFSLERNFRQCLYKMEVENWEQLMEKEYEERRNILLEEENDDADQNLAKQAKRKGIDIETLIRFRSLLQQVEEDETKARLRSQIIANQHHTKIFLLEIEEEEVVYRNKIISDSDEYKKFKEFEQSEYKVIKEREIALNNARRKLMASEMEFRRAINKQERISRFELYLIGLVNHERVTRRELLENENFKREKIYRNLENDLIQQHYQDLIGELMSEETEQRRKIEKESEKVIDRIGNRFQQLFEELRAIEDAIRQEEERKQKEEELKRQKEIEAKQRLREQRRKEREKKELEKQKRLELEEKRAQHRRELEELRQIQKIAEEEQDKLLRRARVLAMRAKRYQNEEDFRNRMDLVDHVKKPKRMKLSKKMPNESNSEVSSSTEDDIYYRTPHKPPYQPKSNAFQRQNVVVTKKNQPTKLPPLQQPNMITSEITDILSIDESRTSPKLPKLVAVPYIPEIFGDLNPLNKQPVFKI